jgi:hypothetical protein
MRRIASGLLLAAALFSCPAAAVAADAASTTVVKVSTPSFPSPVQSAVLGLSLTAVAVVGARVTQRTATTMMYMVLASVALTGVFMAASYRIHTDFNQNLRHLQQSASR